MMRVIVADDEIRVCKLICNLVDWAEFDMQIVDVAHDGLQVLEMIEKHKPDLVSLTSACRAWTALKL